jgi:hypothetical protein
MPIVGTATGGYLHGQNGGKRSSIPRDFGTRDESFCKMDLALWTKAIVNLPVPCNLRVRELTFPAPIAFPIFCFHIAWMASSSFCPLAALA